MKKYEDKFKRVLIILKSIILIDLIERFKEKTNSKEFWNIINKIYNETLFDIINWYFNKL